MDEDLGKALNSVLSDPESMQQLKELAQMLKAEGVGSDDSKDPSDTSASDPGQSGGADIGSVMKLMQAVSAADGNDSNRQLLLALRPHLSEPKQERIDKAVKLMKLLAVINSLKDSGMLGEIGKLL